jgi:hypothetical protein
MSKRFTDTAIWDKPWFRMLAPCDKCAMRYIFDKCDNVGVWVPDFEAAEFFIGDKINWEALPNKVNGNIVVLDNGKWYLTDFCDFQYGELKETNPPHRSYIKLLEKHGLLKGLPRGINASKEKEKDKDKDKEKDKDSFGEYVKLTKEQYDILCFHYGRSMVDSKIEDINNWVPNHKPYKDYAATIRAWFKKDGVAPKSADVKRCEKGHVYTGDICENCI